VSLIRDRLLAIVRDELRRAVADDATMEQATERIVDRLLEGRDWLRSGRRIYDRLRERLLGQGTRIL
jgi:hypothetical protein